MGRGELLDIVRFEPDALQVGGQVRRQRTSVSMRCVNMVELQRRRTAAASPGGINDKRSGGQYGISEYSDRSYVDSVREYDSLGESDHGGILVEGNNHFVGRDGDGWEFDH
jgi:hypothetical protein